MYKIHPVVYGGAAAEGQRAALVGLLLLEGYQRGLLFFRENNSTYSVSRGCKGSRRTKPAGRGDRGSTNGAGGVFSGQLPLPWGCSLLAPSLISLSWCFFGLTSYKGTEGSG